MRNAEKGTFLELRAVAGLHVVTLAWNFLHEPAAPPNGLLGFALERTEFDAGGKAKEKYWLRGIKRFANKDEGLAPGSPVPTSEHPIQTFQWGDYTAYPDTTYEYRVVPVSGTPKLLQLDDARATTVRITTEREAGKADAGPVRHDIYFNRGVAGSQAYARKFGKTKPDENKPESEQMKWLSRGLYEALLGFISEAKNSTYALHAMLYEFHYPGVGQAFKDAAKAGAAVSIRYEAQSYKADNEAMIKSLAISRLCKPQRSRSGVRHNKFIVLSHKGKPVAVWTGSTNISAGGIFGHSNVGHIIRDAHLAQQYLDFWSELAEPDVTAAPLREANNTRGATPANAGDAPATAILPLFCARDPNNKNVPTLQWYGDLLASAQNIACITFAFNLDDIFVKALNTHSGALKYGVLDKLEKNMSEVDVKPTSGTVLAAGALLKKGDMENFLGEELTGFNRNRYIHDKFILIDPLGDDPVVVTGTANFSRPSQTVNDENMLVIRGNTRVSDIYFGEFMRIFDHLYSRYIVDVLKKEGKNDPKAGYLKETAKDWLAAHLKDGVKKRRRLNFMK